MMFKIKVESAETDEVLSAARVVISTNPEDIRAAKAEAAQLVEDAVNVLLERALGPPEVVV